MGGWGALPVVWAVTAMAVFGCDGDGERLSKADYQAELSAVIADTDEPTALYTDLVVEPRPRERCAAGVATFENQVDALVDRVAALRPPERVEAIHDDFLAAARTSVERIGDVRDRVADGDVACGDELNRELYGMPSTREAERAIGRLESQGYVVFGE